MPEIMYREAVRDATAEQMRGGAFGEGFVPLAVF